MGLSKKNAREAFLRPKCWLSLYLPLSGNSYLALKQCCEQPPCISNEAFWGHNFIKFSDDGRMWSLPRAVF